MFSTQYPMGISLHKAQYRADTLLGVHSLTLFSEALEGKQVFVP